MNKVVFGVGLWLLLSALPVQAKNFIVGTNSTTREAFPWLEEKIAKAIKLAGHSVTFELVPPARGLLLAQSGQLDGEIYRNPEAIGKVETLIPISTPVMELKLWVIGHKDLTIASKLDLKKLRPIGVNGVLIFRIYERDCETVVPLCSDVRNALSMLVSKRADFTIWHDEGLQAWARDKSAAISSRKSC